jgi:hypothetical protein
LIRAKDNVQWLTWLGNIAKGTCVTVRRPDGRYQHGAVVEARPTANLGSESSQKNRVKRRTLKTNTPNHCGASIQSDPTLSSIATSIMITTSNSPAKGSGMPKHYGGDLLHTMAISGLSRVRTEVLLFVVPAAPPHPVQLDRQVPGHGYFAILRPRRMARLKKLAAPLRLTAP